MVKTNPEELRREKEKKIDALLSFFLSEDEEILWRGKIAQEFVQKTAAIIKFCRITILILIAGGFFYLAIVILILGMSNILLFSIIIGLGIIPPVFIGDQLLRESANLDYLITSKKIIEIDHRFVEPNITVLDFDKIDQVNLNTRFKKIVEFFVLRGNKNTKRIQELEFHSQYLATHPEACIFFISNGLKEPSLEFLEGNDCLKFKFLGDGERVEAILKGIIPEKFL